MAKQQINKVDSISNEKNAQYQKRGITYVSNIPTVNLRDNAGNIQFKEDRPNRIVIIEPISTKITTKSVIKILDTQFNYFKFPARTTIVEEEPLDLDLDIDLNIQDQINEAIAADIIPPLPSEYKPSTDQRIPLGDWGNPSILDFSTVVTGPAQLKPNTLEITQELLDQLLALQTDTDTPVLRIAGRIKTSYNAGRRSAIGFSIGLANSALRFTMNSPADDIVTTGDDIVKAKREGVYTTNISATVGLSELYVGQELQIRGWAEDSQDNRNHTIQANDSYIRFGTGVI